MPSSDQLQILERLKQLRVWQQQQQESLLLRQQEQLAKLRGQEDSHRRQVGINFSGDRSSTSASSMSSSEDTTLRSLPETHPSQTLGSAANYLLLNHNDPFPGNGLPHKPVSTLPIARVNGMVNSVVPNGLLPLDSFSDGKDVKMNSNHFTPMPSCQLVQPSNAVRAVTIANGVLGIDSSETNSSDLSPLSEDSTALTADGVEEGQRVDNEKNAVRDQADDQIEACYHAFQPVSFPGSPTHKSLGTRLFLMMLTEPSSAYASIFKESNAICDDSFLMHNCMTDQ